MQFIRIRESIRVIIDIEIRGCLNVQYTDIRLEKIGSLILENLGKNKVVCIFKGHDYYTCIDWMALQPLSSQEELLEYIDKRSVHGWVNGFEKDEIEKLFLMYKDANTIFLEEPKIDSDALWAANKIEVRGLASEVDFSIYLKLKQKGICVNIVNVPDKVKNVYGLFCTMSLTEQWMRETKGDERRIIEGNLRRITELTTEEYFAQVLDKFYERNCEKQLGNKDADRTIFLVGPCIVAGYSSSEKYLAEFLTELIEECEFSYKIVKISGMCFPNEILEYDIARNDIVIFMGSGLRYKDFDLTEDYEGYRGTKNLCTNHTLHSSKAGCKLIADALMRDIVIPGYTAADAIYDKQILHTAEKEQLWFETEYEVKLYLRRLNIPKYMRKGNNGAIVMNANPFTVGHRNLAEYAAGQVDRLFVFVVEEDASFFSFEERFEMVLRGTEDIENITVITSGNFIISNKTFYDYFTKETDNGKTIDASKDILIFARYIVPYFNIRKRFVGEEPIDKITQQYNEQMKSILPKYGCNLIEIPRFKNEGRIVSGSAVRKAIQEKDSDCLKKLLPTASYGYIDAHLESFQNRDVGLVIEKRDRIYMTDRMMKIAEMLDIIEKEEKIVIYGVGYDTAQLLKLLKREVLQKLIFVDKRAEMSELLFMGKSVLPPSELQDRYTDYYILIFSSKYYKEIYYDCIELGFEERRIKYNPYDLAVGFTLET